jgi:hypothetical protein
MTPWELDEIERAARLLAAAFAPGQPWAARTAVVKPDDLDIAANDRLAVVSRGRTLERKRDLACVPDEQAAAKAMRAALMSWNITPASQGSRPDRVRESVAWRTTRVTAVPHAAMRRDAIAALAFAKLDGPLEAWLLVYAIQDLARWPVVERFAVASGLYPVATRDAATRILGRVAGTSQDARARELGIRANTYRQQTRRAERVLEDWLLRASRRVLSMLGVGTDLHPAKGNSNRASSNEASREQNMKPTMQLDAADRARLDRLTIATERLALLVQAESRPRSAGVLRLRPGVEHLQPANVVRMADHLPPLKRAG